ncbi:TPA: hypothetical protein ACGO6Q_000643, partial [Streptococcus suis]
MTQTQIELKFIKSSQLRLLLIFEEYKSTLFVFPTVIANWVLFLPFVKSIKVFDEKYFESRNPNKEI